MTKALIKRSYKIVDQKKQNEDIVEWGNIAFIQPEPKKKIDLSTISKINEFIKPKINVGANKY